MNPSEQIDELSDFVEHAALPLHWVNGSGIVVWVNGAELALLGYDKEEMVNKHINNFHADKHVLEDILARLINKETLVNYPARLISKSGEIKDVLINSNVLWKDNKFIHTRCFTTDITALKNNEETLKQRIAELQEENKKLLEGHLF